MQFQIYILAAIKLKTMKAFYFKVLKNASFFALDSIKNANLF